MQNKYIGAFKGKLLTAKIKRKYRKQLEKNDITSENSWEYIHLSSEMVRGQKIVEYL